MTHDRALSTGLSRRQLILGTGAAALGAGLAGVGHTLTPTPASAAAPRRREGDPRPNVVWIITDDATRRTLRTMPHTMRLLVRPGVNFVNGYVAVPWCGPSRASMLTGMYPHNHGCNSNMTHPKFVHEGLDRDTVATRMAAAGYTNGYFGKYMNGLGSQPGYVAPGWHRWVADTDADAEYDVDGEVRELDTTRHLPDAFAAKRLGEFVRMNADRPFFAVFAPTAPHDPYTPSAKHAHDFDHVAWDPPSFNKVDPHEKMAWMQSLPPVDHHQMRQIWEGKLEELRDVDDQVRNLVRTLKEVGQWDNTVVMMISDNGYLLGEHRLFRKEQPYEESAGVPFTITGAGFEPGPSLALASSLDLMPTTLALAGLDPDAGRVLDGRSMLPHLRTGDWSSWRERLLVENTHLGWSMLREGDLAYIDYYSRGGQELYNLRQDPYEMRSLDAPKVESAEYARVTALGAAAGYALRDLET